MNGLVRLSALLVVGAVLRAAPLAWGQASAAQGKEYVPALTSEVVSIRETKRNPDGSYSMSGQNPPHASMISVTNYRVADLIAMAYGIDSRHISGLPEWANATRYNFQARSDSSVDEVLAKLDDKRAGREKQHMLQVMLAERFKLKLHPETRTATVYELAVAKTGVKLQTSKRVEADSDDAKAVAAANEPDMRQSCGPAGCEMTGTRFRMKDVAEFLGGQLSTSVEDKTGLTGAYDFKLQWTGRDFLEPGDDGSRPPLPTAVQTQLGLQLKAVKGTIPELVIDHVEKPSEN